MSCCRKKQREREYFCEWLTGIVGIAFKCSLEKHFWLSIGFQFQSMEKSHVFLTPLKHLSVKTQRADYKRCLKSHFPSNIFSYIVQKVKARGCNGIVRAWISALLPTGWWTWPCYLISQVQHSHTKLTCPWDRFLRTGKDVLGNRIHEQKKSLYRQWPWAGQAIQTKKTSRLRKLAYPYPYPYYCVGSQASVEHFLCTLALTKDL